MTIITNDYVKCLLCVSNRSNQIINSIKLHINIMGRDYYCAPSPLRNEKTKTAQK